MSEENTQTELGEEAAPTMVEYVVLKGPVANPEAEVFQTGNVMLLPEGDVFAAHAVEAGLIARKEATAGQGQVVASGEPRARFRGQIVLTETERTVENQTFKHIRIADGSEYDLTESEYALEVRVSFPPNA